jgi:hypothetical protein
VQVGEIAPMARERSRGGSSQNSTSPRAVSIASLI